MANVPESSSFDAGIYQIETADPVLGGVNGIANAQAKGLANRTKYLNDQLALKAPIASPAFTGNPTAPTPAVDDNDASIATTAFVQTELAAEAYGRLLNIQTFNASGTYTPTAGTKKVLVKVQGGGGSGGGSPATGSAAISIGSGGTAGAYAESLITSGFSGASVTVGSGGAAVTGQGSNFGGTSSFGALVSAPGGPGGSSQGPTGAPFISGSGQSSPATGGNIVNSCGEAGGTAFALNAISMAQAGAGGSSAFGGGGAGASTGANGQTATSRGAGGGGTAAVQNTTALTGGAGAPGVVIVFEYA